VDVAGEVRLGGHRLEPHGRLLLPDAELTDHVTEDHSAARLLASRADGPLELLVAFLVALLGDALAGDAPRGEGGGPYRRPTVWLFWIYQATDSGDNKLEYEAYCAGYVAAVAYHTQLSGRVNLWKGFLSR